MRLVAFQTERLTISHWADELADSAGRKRIERALKDLLTPNVLAPLPPAMQLSNTLSALTDWVDARNAESDVYLITLRAPEPETRRLIGMVFLLDLSEGGDIAQMHLGYLLAERDWGQGYATEMLMGFMEVLQELAPLSVLAGVGRDNPASARVLEKTGFTRDRALSCDETDMFVQVFASPQ
ncbi:GNAT family N-acetyltransferase [Aliiroseovarius sp. KMU-50]|uniref:GNAT family N-acetyltransferase n=1 Tax=Aliiroseovarius salicola TaxID=3009082 RepID=A0ABT4W4L7_9RHOB|nr:GNAT family N-acetyltransferase [Aliiroseovarius sp. KMU-50]MDA5095460.1 GNAT family N-acetyltransferase [Aliiroseovarius sp. KMU-50]